MRGADTIQVLSNIKATRARVAKALRISCNSQFNIIRADPEQLGFVGRLGVFFLILGVCVCVEMLLG